MSEFSTYMAHAWAQSARVFGDSCVIAGQTYGCIIHALEYGDGVDPSRAGRSQAVSGQVVMRQTDWATAVGRKGINITFDFGTFRVSNNPDVGPSSEEVVLNIAPLT